MHRLCPIKTIVSLALILLLSGCSTQYRPFVQPVYATGAGGEKTSFYGMDLWRDGRPPRRFMVIGSIVDTRPCGAIAMCFKGAQVARLAKEQGGDALIIGFDKMASKWNGLASPTQNQNLQATSPDFMRAPIENQVTKYYVIKYL
jgi:hypothetical protein